MRNRRAAVRTRACRVGGILAGAVLLAATASGARAAAPVGGLAPETPDQAPPSSPVPRLEPADLGLPARPLATWQLALLDVAAILPTGVRPGAPDPRAPHAVEPVALSSRSVSGLPWLSGVGCPPPGMDRWRGRRFDTAWFGMPK